MGKFCGWGGDDDEVAGKDPTCEYYGCLPALIPRASVGNSSSHKEHGDPSGLSVFSGSVPVVCNQHKMPPRPPRTLRLVIISDTHERHREVSVPGGDVLIHCGDIQQGITLFSNPREAVKDFFHWFNDTTLHPHPVKLIIAGNHDKELARNTVEGIRALAAPALYLQDESAVIEPLGIRVYGSPRSTANSSFSPNTAFQSAAAWAPFPRNLAPSEVTSAEHQKRHSPVHLSVRLEGTQPGGPIDILLTHQGPEVCTASHPVDEQEITKYVMQVQPRRLHCSGHLHRAHGLHRLPLPFSVNEAFLTRFSPQHTDNSLSPIPFLPSINAAMLLRHAFREVLQLPCVVDLEI